MITTEPVHSATTLPSGMLAEVWVGWHYCVVAVHGSVIFAPIGWGSTPEIALGLGAALAEAAEVAQTQTGPS